MLQKSRNGWPRIALCRSLQFIILLIFVLAANPEPSFALTQDSTNPLEHFPDDFYKVQGKPDLAVSMERSSAYQGEDASLFLTLINRGSVTSFEVNNEPEESRPDEIFAAQMELDLERGRTTAQDISVVLKMSYQKGDEPLEIKREVAYSGALREGQVSPVLEFPVEIYENTPPGDYILRATINYTYQQDVAVETNSESPQNPDIFYLYKSESSVIPLTLRIERKTGVEFDISSANPVELKIGSKDNIVKVTVENVGDDTARNVVARLRPESGIYVSADESPIPILSPNERAELVFKLDVSKDAIAEKYYMLTLLFDFSDTFRDDLTDTEHFYLLLEPKSAFPPHLIGLLVAIVAVASLIEIRKRRGDRI
jgi:hypothetical protein